MLMWRAAPPLSQKTVGGWVWKFSGVAWLSDVGFKSLGFRTCELQSMEYGQTRIQDEALCQHLYFAITAKVTMTFTVSYDDYG